MTGSLPSYCKRKWWTHDTVAVVTGANKGIGKEISRILAQQGVHTIMTARNEALGMAAAAEVKAAAGPDAGVEFQLLDIASPASIELFANWLRSSHGSVTLLVNNAGMAYKGNVFGPDETRNTLATNYYGTIALTEALLPLIPDVTGRIVTVSSTAGSSSIIRKPELRQRFLAAESQGELDALMAEFQQAVDSRSDAALASAGWPKSMYGMSKLGLTMYCRLLAERVQPRHILVNACCPGWCQTDMSSMSGRKTAAQGADTPVWLALRDAEDAQTGGLWADRKLISY